jgi:hypothetical protein
MCETKQATQATSGDELGTADRRARTLRLPPRVTGVRALAVVSFLAGAAVVLAARPFTNAESGDDSIYDYIAQSILRGQVPYRDVIDPKTPGSSYLSAAAMIAGRAAGARDVIAVRWLHVLMFGLLAATTFLVGERYFENRLAAAIGFLVPLMISGFTPLVIRGTQPKLSLMLFGMLSLLMIATNRPFWAGVTSMLSSLCWQPGLMFTGVAVLIFSRYLTSWRDSRALRVVLGALTPLTILILYFMRKGALGELWSWTIVFPYTVFAPESAMPLAGEAESLWLVILRGDAALALFALAGLVIYSATRVVNRIRNRGSSGGFKDALIFPPVIYLVFCLINFQNAPDLIPFFPFIGLFTGWLAAAAGGLLARVWPRARVALPAAVIIIIVSLIAIRNLAPGRAPDSLSEQEEEARFVESLLGPNDKIYVHGRSELLVLLNRPNLNKYIGLDTGADQYVARGKPGGFRDVIDEMEAEAPKVLAITRLRNVRHRGEIEDWINQHYQKVKFEKLRGIYIRRQ